MKRVFWPIPLCVVMMFRESPKLMRATLLEGSGYQIQIQDSRNEEAFSS